MLVGQIFYLTLVIAAFSAFALVLAGASWYQGSATSSAAPLPQNFPAELQQQVQAAVEPARDIAA